MFRRLRHGVLAPGQRLNRTAVGIAAGKTVCEDTSTARDDETIGFIVFEAGRGTTDGVEFEAH